MRAFSSADIVDASRIPSRQGRLLAACAMLVSVAWYSVGFAQTDQTKQLPTPQVNSSNRGQPVGRGGYTLQIVTREVVVEIVARDRHGKPMDDISQDELQIFEGTHKSKDGPKLIAGFRTIDPDSEKDRLDGSLQNAVLPLGGRCEIRSTIHYELAFHPTKWTGGYHSILVVTTRPNVTLSYRTRYYIGVSDTNKLSAHQDPRAVNAALLKAACYHSDVPSSISLHAERMQLSDVSRLRYSVTVLPSSLGLAGIDDDANQVQLEYGVCTFGQAGNLIGYWRFGEDRSLSAVAISSVVADGWPESVDIPRHGRPTLLRFVVMEPKSGNLGTIDVLPHALIPRDKQDDPELNARTHILLLSDTLDLQARRGSSLGSAIPKSHALCGDVYELPTTTTFLPSDFRRLDSVGAVYANSLNVAEQILTYGLPGSSPRSEWFAIDYYGEFWVNNAGTYEFTLNADDGADLSIDEKMLINDDGIHPPRTITKSMTLEAGRHTIHLPYFQGPTYVNLILKIKPPGGELKIFDVRDFPEHSSNASPTG